MIVVLSPMGDIPVVSVWRIPAPPRVSTILRPLSSPTLRDDVGIADATTKGVHIVYTLSETVGCDSRHLYNSRVSMVADTPLK